MRCSFCDTEGHLSLRIIPVPINKRGAPSSSADPKTTWGTGGACDACLPMVTEARKTNTERV